MMICNKCGGYVSDDARFCVNCGAEITKEDVNVQGSIDLNKVDYSENNQESSNYELNNKEYNEQQYNYGSQNQQEFNQQYSYGVNNNQGNNNQGTNNEQYGNYQENSYQNNNYQGNNYQNNTPNYSQPYNNGYNTKPVKKDNGFAIASLVLGISSLVLFCTGIFGIVLGILAIVFGILQIRKKQEKGMAIGGIVTGSVAIVISAILLIFAIAVENAGTSYYDDYDYYDSFLEDFNSIEYKDIDLYLNDL